MVAVDIRPPERAERDEIIDLATAVFVDDPRYASIADAGARTRSTHLDLAASVRSCWSRSSISVALDGDGMCGALMYHPPNFRGPSLLAACWYSLVWSHRVTGSHYKRSAATGNRFEESRAIDPHFYVTVVAVHPRAQGGGIGSRLMESLIQRSDDEQRSIQLHTSNARNHPFYERLGFRSVNSFLMRPDTRVHTLQRDPHRPRPSIRQ